MQADHQAQVAFHLTGTRAGALHAIDEFKLKPALFAPYRDLSKLRYDFPVVLLRANAAVPFASLSSIVDLVISKLEVAADTPTGARRQILDVERDIRELLENGASGTLLKMWDLATSRVIAANRRADATVLRKARAALDCEGQLVDCNATMPARVFIRAWRHVNDRKAAAFREHVGRLTARLDDILRADFVASEAGHSPETLKESVGTPYADVFDFDAMSKLLGKVSSPGLPESRRHRIEEALAVLQGQRFYPDPEHRRADDGYTFVFASSSDVEEAYRERMPELVQVAKAIAIAELEVAGEYNPARHDAFFAAFGQNGLGAEELARFPDYLLWTYAKTPDEHADIGALLAAHVPVKVLVQFDDLLEASPVQEGQLTLSLRCKQLADMAIGLTDVYVLQCSASAIVQMRDAILRGLSFEGASLFSVYSGSVHEQNGVPPYLLSAAATESATICSTVIGKCGDIHGMCVAPVVALVMITLPVLRITSPTPPSDMTNKSITDSFKLIKVGLQAWLGQANPTPVS